MAQLGNESRINDGVLRIDGIDEANDKTILSQ